MHCDVFLPSLPGPSLLSSALGWGCSQTSGIAVGLDSDYGAAQRLYVKRGYVPDGRGIWSHGHQVQWGETVLVDDHTLLYFTKRLQG